MKIIPRSKLLMMSTSDENLFVEQMRETRATNLLIHEVQYVQGTKPMKLTYKPVFVSFQKVVIRSGDN